jgi:hypothetical protein
MKLLLPPILLLLTLLPAEKGCAEYGPEYYESDEFRNSTPVTGRGIDPRRDYFISFCANSDRMGHAFISFGYRSQADARWVHGGAWGFYPQDELWGLFSVAIGEVPGYLKDDCQTRSDICLMMPISYYQYQRVQQVVVDWRNRRYVLYEKDCISFLIAVADALGGIRLPQRTGISNFPTHFVQEMIALNHQALVRR